jgi:hypothetical protein
MTGFVVECLNHTTSDKACTCVRCKENVRVAKHSLVAATVIFTAQTIVDQLIIVLECLSPLRSGLAAFDHSIFRYLPYNLHIF